MISDTSDLVLTRDVGRGRIVVTGFSLTQRDFSTWAGRDGFINGALMGNGPRVFISNDSDFPLGRNKRKLCRHEPHGKIGATQFKLISHNPTADFDSATGVPKVLTTIHRNISLKHQIPTSIPMAGVSNFRKHTMTILTTTPQTRICIPLVLGTTPRNFLLPPIITRRSFRNQYPRCKLRGDARRLSRCTCRDELRGVQNFGTRRIRLVCCSGTCDPWFIGGDQAGTIGHWVCPFTKLRSPCWNAKRTTHEGI